MGLETVNYSFRTDTNIIDSFDSLAGLMPLKRRNGNKYWSIDDINFWIDLEVISDTEIQIRATLCNDRVYLIKNLFYLFEFLFSHFESSTLIDLHSRSKWKNYSQQLKEEVLGTYELRKSNFQKMYGDYSAAVSADKFNDLKHSLRISEGNNSKV